MSEYKYDVAISFAGEQRTLAESLATRLDAAGFSVFYDKFEAAELWGRDLTISLGQVYAHEARYCLVLLSNEYTEKAWTNLERQNAISRFMRDRQGYVLCVRIDEIQLPGLPDVIGYVDFEPYGEEGVYRLLLQKLGAPSQAGQASKLDSSDCGLARRVIQACYRRAIFTRMQGEIDLDAMHTSIGHALGEIQRLIPSIQDQTLQNLCLEIVGALDAVERFRVGNGILVSRNFPPHHLGMIDEQKLKVVRALLEIRRLAQIPMQLPFSLQYGHFFSLAEANSPPDAGL
jgi:hypothetical protein